MAIGRVKTWIVEVLTAADLNAEFNNIINNALSLISPLTGTLDANGNEIVLDADADTSITADTDDRIDFRLSGADLFRMDGTVTTPVNGINFVASATGVAVHALALGTDTNIDLELRSKGSGDVVLADDSGNEILVAADVASAVNEVTVTNAVTTAPPFVQATGGDTNIDLELRSKGSGDVVLADDSGNEILVAADVASAVNEVTVTNATTTANPLISVTGDDANISLLLRSKGTGEIALQDGEADGIANFRGVTSAINRFNFTNASTGNPILISAVGTDTNVDIKLVPKGTGRVDNILPRSYLAGLGLSNGTDATNDIDIAVGEARSTANDVDLVVSTAIGKQIDVSWATGGTTGTPTGGLSSSLTLTNDTWYHVILGLVSGTAEVGFDTSITGANLVTDHSFTNTRRIGSIRRDTATNRAFLQRGDEFLWDVQFQDLTTNPGATTAQTLALRTPLGIRTKARLIVKTTDPAGNFMLVTSLDQTDTAASATAYTLTNSGSAAASAQNTECERWTDTSSQIRWRVSSTGITNLQINTVGWTDRRGRDA